MIATLLAILLSTNVTTNQIGTKNFVTFDITTDAPLTEAHAMDVWVTFNTAAGQQTIAYHNVYTAGPGTFRFIAVRVPADYSVASYTVMGWGPI